MKDYDLKIEYHPGKANVVAYSLSRKSVENLKGTLTSQKQLVNEFERLNLEVIPKIEGGLLAAIIAQLSLLQEIKTKQLQDPFFKKIVDELPESKQPEFSFYDNVLRFINRLYSECWRS